MLGILFNARSFVTLFCYSTTLLFYYRRNAEEDQQRERALWRRTETEMSKRMKSLTHNQQEMTEKVQTYQKAHMDTQQLVDQVERAESSLQAATRDHERYVRDSELKMMRLEEKNEADGKKHVVLLREKVDKGKLLFELLLFLLIPVTSSLPKLYFLIQIDRAIVLLLCCCFGKIINY